MDHALRRSRLSARFEELGVDGVLVTRLPNVRYLTGFSGSNGQALLTAGGGVFFTDGRYAEQAAHEVSSGLDPRIYLDGSPPVPEAVRDLGIGSLGFETAGITHRTWRGLTDRLAGIELVPLEGEVERLRVCKDADEIELIERAQAAADEAFERVVLGGSLKPGVTERTIALELEIAMREAGAEDRGFDPVVAFGESGAEPHHHPGDHELREGEAVTLDFGALVQGYRSDMTRTVSVGEPHPRLREIREIVAAAQAAGLAAVRAGARVSEVDAAARAVIAEPGYGDAFPHPLGHGVGLEIHEDPFLRGDREDVLPEGAVVTIEPGVYLPGLGGVRIEDMVEVTASGGRVIPTSTKELNLT